MSCASLQYPSDASYSPTFNCSLWAQTFCFSLFVDGLTSINILNIKLVIFNFLFSHMPFRLPLGPVDCLWNVSPISFFPPIFPVCQFSFSEMLRHSQTSLNLIFQYKSFGTPFSIQDMVSSLKHSKSESS